MDVPIGVSILLLIIKDLSFPIFSSRWSMESEHQLASTIRSKVSTLQIGLNEASLKSNINLNI